MFLLAAKAPRAGCDMAHRQKSPPQSFPQNVIEWLPQRYSWQSNERKRTNPGLGNAHTTAHPL